MADFDKDGSTPEGFGGSNPTLADEAEGLALTRQTVKDKVFDPNASYTERQKAKFQLNLFGY